MTPRPLLLFALALLPAALAPLVSAQDVVLRAPDGPVTLPAGTQLPLAIPNHLPMRVGQPLRAELLYPVYRDNRLIVPAHTVVTGSVVALTPDHARRVKARLRLDFTPFHTPVVRFDAMVAPDGTRTPIVTGEASGGAPVYRVVRDPDAEGSLFHRLFAQARQQADDTIQTFVGPDKGDRFTQFIYNQLPYHPERISSATAWTVETAAPLTLPTALPAPAAPPPPPRGHLRLVHPAPSAAAHAEATAAEHPTWVLQAYLDQAISSEFSSANQRIQATVAEPVLNPDGSVAVPEGAVLSGTVTQARPARRFARVGVLRFNFSQLTLPDQAPQTVRTTLTGADSSSAQALNIDSEGRATPKTENKVVIPALLLLLAARQPYLAAGLGYYSAALSIYPRWFAKGAAVSFPKDTRVVIQTAGTRSGALKPATASNP